MQKIEPNKIFWACRSPLKIGILRGPRDGFIFAVVKAAFDDKTPDNRARQKGVKALVPGRTLPRPVACRSRRPSR